MSDNQNNNSFLYIVLLISLWLAYSFHSDLEEAENLLKLNMKDSDAIEVSVNKLRQQEDGKEYSDHQDILNGIFATAGSIYYRYSVFVKTHK
jgi:hypothetical protein